KFIASFVVIPRACRESMLEAKPNKKGAGLSRALFAVLSHTHLLVKNPLNFFVRKQHFVSEF
ncbi:MAG: hypothetical protein AB7P12_09415, partial [Alphaproteobacteria bacterium]